MVLLVGVIAKNSEVTNPVSKARTNCTNSIRLLDSNPLLILAYSCKLSNATFRSLPVFDTVQYAFYFVQLIIKFDFFFVLKKFRVLGIKNDHPFMLVKFKI